jgi:1,3-beta-glucan synthase
MSGHPQQAQQPHQQGGYDDGYGQHQGNDAYYQDDGRGYHDQYDYNQQQHGGEGYYDES